MIEEIDSDVIQIDTLLGGWERVTAAYLVAGPQPVLIETGSASSAPALLAALEELGLSAGDLAAVAVTHIHLDHAGGVGDIARAFPQAEIHVHLRGARHLVDPSRLVESAARVFGDVLDDLYGRPQPVDADRVNVLSEGDEIHIGPDRVLTSVDAIGHAKHHLALHDSASGILFTGDAAGVRLPEMTSVRPATPPADFDLDQALSTLHRLAARRPSGIALAHFGLLAEPLAVLDEAEQVLRQWAEVAKRAWGSGEDVAGALEDAFGGNPDALEDEIWDRLETLNGLQANASGLEHWLSTR